MSIYCYNDKTNKQTNVENTNSTCDAGQKGIKPKAAKMKGSLLERQLKFHDTKSPSTSLGLITINIAAQTVDLLVLTNMVTIESIFKFQCPDYCTCCTIFVGNSPCKITLFILFSRNHKRYSNL